MQTPEPADPGWGDPGAGAAGPHPGKPWLQPRGAQGTPTEMGGDGEKAADGSRSGPLPPLVTHI